jgi:hypothetical protein
VEFYRNFISSVNVVAHIALQFYYTYENLFIEIIEHVTLDVTTADSQVLLF